MSEEGRKDDGGKPRLELLHPSLLFGTAAVLEFGARKYAVRNWEKGIAYGRVFAALQRHLWAWWRHDEVDGESGMSHLFHASCCLMFLIAFSTNAKYVQFDDRPVNE